MRRIKRITLVAFIVFFSFYNPGYPADEKEEIKQYLDKVNLALTNFQITARNLSQKILPIPPAVKQMQDYIETVSSLTPPEVMDRQHRMLLLSFKKLRMGFYVLSHGDKPLSVRLVNRGRDLLQLAIKDILKMAREEGLIKQKQPKTEDK